MAKNKWISYFLWLIGGVFGLHHFYLGRDRQAFVWWCTGGFFGVGVFRDLWRIPDYVDSANNTPEYKRKLIQQMMKNPKPAFSTSRFCAQLVIGTFFGYLTLVAISEDFAQEFPVVRTLVVPFAIALGVHIVGNIGREQQGALKPALYGSYMLSPLFALPSGVAYQAILSAFLFQKNKRFRKTPEGWMTQSICRRLFVLFIAGSCITGLWFSAIYFNASITTGDGETIKVRDAVNHFFNSPFWKEFVATMKRLYQRGKARGWRRLWSDLMDSFDPLGEMNAYKVLGLERGATDAEIKQRYRTLALQYHPDKSKDLDKEEAEKRFMQIQESYETLSKLKKERVARRPPSR
ncbi:dnaJ homolog subfamily C member 22-like [Apostichopus japonicus]|uniref:dnaJ homolog subfamily C member 22-like n=1 Tax=Stichopus japonicus TaxID=307972 RepID=UPI003AB34EB9